MTVPHKANTFEGLGRNHTSIWSLKQFQRSFKFQGSWGFLFIKYVAVKIASPQYSFENILVNAKDLATSSKWQFFLSAIEWEYPHNWFDHYSIFHQTILETFLLILQSNTKFHIKLHIDQLVKHFKTRSHFIFGTH